MIMTKKIISVSRRTDIPAFYSEWFINGIKRGYVDAVNPFNRKYVSRVSLKPEDVICFVFWTKNPYPFMKYLDYMDQLGYMYYFQFTLNPYGNDLEKQVPVKAKYLINVFQELSKRIGKEKVVWRYDPILLNDKYTIDYHLEYFEKLTLKLHDYTERVVISFIDLYQKTLRNTKDLNIRPITEEEINYLGKKFSEIACKYNLSIYTCSEKFDLSSYGIKHSKCIDDELIGKMIDDLSFTLNKDKGQRRDCGCVESIDIGANNTCQHFCAYCYANTSYSVVKKNIKSHNPHSTLLFGELQGDEEIHWRNGMNAISLKAEIKRTIKSNQSKSNQISFKFDSD